VRKTLIVGTAAGVIAAVGLATPASAGSDTSTTEESTATVYILHAIPDTPVDVYVDEELVADDLQPADFTDGMDVDAGTYSVAITADDAEDDSDPLIGPFDVTVEAGESYTGVAHLTEDGDATVSVYVNDLGDYADGEGRLVVRHNAEAPAVDVIVDDEVVVEDLTNPDEASYDLEAATVSAEVALAGESDPVIGPADVEVLEGETTIVYAWGSADDENLDFAVQTLSEESDDDEGDGWDHGDHGDHGDKDYDHGDHGDKDYDHGDHGDKDYDHGDHGDKDYDHGDHGDKDYDHKWDHSKYYDHKDSRH
jgi:hypothetical protein